VQERLADSWAMSGCRHSLLNTTDSGHMSENPMADRLSLRLELCFGYNSKTKRFLDFPYFPTVVNDSREAVG
jgi:hypothetical protein